MTYLFSKTAPHGVVTASGIFPYVDVVIGELKIKAPVCITDERDNNNRPYPLMCQALPVYALPNGFCYWKGLILDHVIY